MKRIAVAVLSLASIASAQQGGAPDAAKGRGRGPQAPAMVSPEMMPDRHVVFRIFAPMAQAVRLTASDIPSIRQGA